MKTRPFDIEAFLANLIPFLNLNEIPHFALINKSTGRVIHQLNTSKKFQKNSGIYNALVISLQKDAKAILDNPISAYNENDKQLLTALNNIMDGKINSDTIQILRKQRLNYQTQSPEGAINAAGGAVKFGFTALERPTGFAALFSPTRDIKVDLALLFFTILIALIILAVGGIEYGIRSCVDSCRAKRQQEKLKQRLQFFKVISDFKDEKKPEDDNNNDYKGDQYKMGPD